MAHKNAHPSEYGTWREMKRRCYSVTCKHYPYWGGRGIRVCEAWRTDFWAFLRDMGPRPSAKHSIERRDNNGHYGPSNCYWATATEQNNNKRSIRRFTFNGETLTLTAWARRTGLPRLCLFLRVYRLGWPIERALTEPRYNAREFHGERKPLRVLAREHGINSTTVHQRLRRGMTLEQALTTPLR